MSEDIFAKWMNDASDCLKKMNIPNFDVDAAMGAHKKNVEAVSNAQKAALQTAKDVNKMHADFMKAATELVGNHAKALKEAKSVEDKSKAHVEHLKVGFEKAMNHQKLVAESWAKTTKGITDGLQTRFQEGLDEIKEHTQKMRSA